MSIAPETAQSRPRRLRSTARWSLVAVCALTMVASTLVGWAVRRSYPDIGGELRVAGLSAPVEVVRDQWGVPQIYADTSKDLFIAQGFVQAQDRFFEMDFRRHVTAGRLAELFGEAQVETDAVIRTMGWREVAEREWALLDATTRGYFESYADGVNAYLDGKSVDEVSLEYTILGLGGLDYQIEPWSGVDSLAWLKAMAWDLKGNYNDELNRARLLADGFSGEQVAELYPAYPEQEHEPIVTAGTVVDGVFSDDSGDGVESSRAPIAELSAEALTGTRQATGLIDEVLGASGADGIGSNSWVVSGDLTDTGKPILANDPHLGPAMPSVWHQVGLRCRQVSQSCPFEVTGFSFAGVPGIMIGHNGDISWGFTNLGPDVTDFYIERLDGDKYAIEEEWSDLTVREETIKVADGEPVTIKVRSTPHGPLMSDRGSDFDGISATPFPQSDGGEYGVALRWTALDPGTTAAAIFELNTASDFEQFQAAATKFEVPSQNLIYADGDGNIGYQSPGRIPIRAKGDGTVPVPGWDPDYAWQDYIPFEELPNVYNPDEGFIVTANNKVIGEQYPYLLSEDFAYGYRSQRIRDMITSAGQDVSVDDIAAMQLDSANTGAPPLLDQIAAVDIDASCRLCGMFDDWDLQQGADSAQAAAYNVVWRNFLLGAFEELPEDMTPGGGERWAQVVKNLSAEPDNPWWDDQSTIEVEELSDVVESALRAADAELTELLGDDPADWRWEDLHTLTVTHQSLGMSGIGWIESVFNAPAIGVSGGDGLVNATGWDVASGYAVDAVPSMRMVVDMADFDKSQWINLTGNSGHAYHQNYRDQLPLWRDGRMLDMAWSAGKVADAAVASLTLTP